MVNGPRTHQGRGDATGLPTPERREIPSHYRWNRVQRTEVQIYCYEQRMQGHTIRDIAVKATEKFNRPISRSSVDKYLQSEIKERRDPLAEDFRQMELDKIQRLELRLNDQLDIAAELQDSIRVSALANALIRVFERRARYQGADAPTTFSSELTVHYTVEGVDLEDLK